MLKTPSAEFAVAAGDALETVDAHVKRVLDRFRSMEHGMGYVALLQKVNAYVPDETVVNPTALITNRAQVTAAVAELLFFLESTFIDSDQPKTAHDQPP